MVVCDVCQKGGEAGPLFKTDTGYRHKACQPTIGQIPSMPPRTRPKLYVAQMVPPKLKDLHA